MYSRIQNTDISFELDIPVACYFRKWDAWGGWTSSSRPDQREISVVTPLPTIIVSRIEDYTDPTSCLIHNEPNPKHTNVGHVLGEHLERYREGTKGGSGRSEEPTRRLLQSKVFFSISMDFGAEFLVSSRTDCLPWHGEIRVRGHLPLAQFNIAHLP